MCFQFQLRSRSQIVMEEIHSEAKHTGDHPEQKEVHEEPKVTKTKAPVKKAPPKKPAKSKETKTKKLKFPKFNWNGIAAVGKCVDVYDGDTITIEMDMRLLIKKYYSADQHALIDRLPYSPIYLHCRMAGYNSAEVSHCTPEEKVLGLKAKEYMANMVFGKEVWCHCLEKGEGLLIKLKSPDPYGRPITDVHLWENGQKGKYLNKDMIESGHAKAYDGRGEKLY